ncbi:Ig-like domain-containing protein [Clostridium akagii]|uniref:Ig-like domain-containing protein n=1 Tax=Clostridium akagii TaxID=91623 RepID=UPI0004787EA2|nr:Ig-like domain-containing protein [Clostridium akagii]
MITIIAQNRFIREIVNIKRWYLSTMISYEISGQTLKNQINSELIDQTNIDNALGEKDSNPYALMRRLSVENTKLCRELSLIRCISALEVYLIASINEVFMQNKQPFLANSIIQYHIGEILTCSNIEELHDKYIEKCCRDLHSGGYGEVRKYYKKTFDIDFDVYNAIIDGFSVNNKYIEQAHDKRHLLIHQLGKIDDNYKKKYNATDMIITETHQEMLVFFQAMLSFSKFVQKKIDKFILSPSKDNKIYIKIIVKSVESRQYIDPTYDIKIRKNTTIKLSSILESVSYNDDENTISIGLQGDFLSIRKYYKQLKKIASKGDIEIISYDSTHVASNPKIKQFPWSDIEAVMNELPERPWEKHIHKKIATKLGWSNNKVSNIINLIQSEPQTTIKLNKNNIQLDIGEEYDLVTSVEPTEAKYKIVSWITENSQIAIVKEGHVTALSKGKTTITARVNDNKSRTKCVVEVLETMNL